MTTTTATAPMARPASRRASRRPDQRTRPWNGIVWTATWVFTPARLLLVGAGRPALGVGRAGTSVVVDSEVLLEVEPGVERERVTLRSVVRNGCASVAGAP